MKKLFLLIGILVYLGGCAQSPVRNPFAGRQALKLGELPEIKSESTSSARVMWTVKALSKQEPFTKLTPTMDESVIYTADRTGKVVALNRQTGKKIWAIHTKKRFTAGPTLMDKMLLLATADAKVVAIEAQTGHALWETKASSEILAPPIGEQGIVLVHAIDGSVSALEAQKGALLWRVEQSTPSLTLHSSSAPVIAGDTVFVGFSTGKLIALNLQTGLIEWERIITLPRGRSELQRMIDITADPVVIDNRVYVVNYQGKLAAVDIHSGDLMWERDISAYQNMAFDEEHLYITDNDYHLWAIDQESGATLWKSKDLAQRYITNPAVVEGKIVVGDQGGYIHFISREDGALLSRMHVATKFYQGPVVRDKAFWINAQNGKVVAIQVLDKEES